MKNKFVTFSSLDRVRRYLLFQWRSAQRFPMTISVLLIGLILSGCGPGPSTPPPQLDVSITQVSNGTPAMGDIVTISWEYEQEQLLSNQVIQLLSLTIDGKIFSQTQGCLPDDLLPPGSPAQACLSVGQRGTTLTFTGPVLFRLIAVDQNDRRIEKIVKLKLEGMSFRMDAQPQQNGYPRIPMKPWEFERVFGIYENVEDSNGEDGDIDQLANDPVLGTVFPGSQPFFLYSRSPLESEGFGATRGGGFPILDSEFLFSPAGEQFLLAGKTEADGVIFAATIGIEGGGSTATKKAENGSDVEIITPPSTTIYEPVFVQIDIRSTDDGSELVISDIHVGNINQGLVLSTYFGHISPLIDPTLGEYEFTIGPGSGIVGLSTGHVTDALTGFVVTTASGEFFQPAQASVSLSWTNVPFYRDDNIGGLLSTFPQVGLLSTFPQE